MPQLIRSRPVEQNQIVVAPGKTLTDLCSFRLLYLEQGQSVAFSEPGFEHVLAVLSGKADIDISGKAFHGVGRRSDIWSGQADSVYAGTSSQIRVTGIAPKTEIAVAGGRCEATYAPFRVLPEEVEMVDVGSADTHSRRRIYHILGQNAAGRAGNLLVSELYADPGCWSGYPPHKHDTENPPEETDFQEVYHYRFKPESGFGTQLCYLPAAEPQVVMTKQGDTFLVDKGYHPTSASPGHAGYIFTILVGRHHRSLVQRFDPAHAHLMGVIPGLQAMRDKFK